MDILLINCFIFNWLLTNTSRSGAPPLFYALKPFFEVFLWSLDKLFQITRKKIEPTYPYNRKTRKIILPKNIENEIYQIAIKVDKPKAVKKVIELTGAGLRVSKDYVDNLLMNMRTDFKAKGARSLSDLDI